MIPCQILGINHSINILEEGVVEVFVSAMVQPVGHGASGRVTRTAVPSTSERDRDRERERSSPFISPRDLKSRSQSFENLRPTVTMDSELAMEVDSKRQKNRNESISSNDSSSNHFISERDADLNLAFDFTSSEHTSTKARPSSPSQLGREDDIALSFSSPAATIVQSSTAGGGLGSRRQSSSVMKTGGSGTSVLDNSNSSSSSSGRGALPGLAVVTESMVLLSSLPCIPGAHIVKYLGPVQLHFIKARHHLPFVVVIILIFF